MKRLLQCVDAARLLSHVVVPCQPLLASRRHCATTPSEDDVLKAYKTLGVHATATLADVKKRYGALAKEHHPDVSTSTTTSSTNRMTDINTAYNTVKLFYQSGGRLTSRPSSSSGPSGAGGASSSSSYYTKHDSTYQPWYEDMDPLMYELMWEEMRRQNEEDHFAQTPHAANFYRMGNQWRPPWHNNANNNRNNNKQQRQQSSQGNNGSDRGGGQGNTNANTNSSKASTKSTTWPEEQVKAMVNMYQDGKSFEFIANALGKDNANAVMEEFNRWSSDNQSNRRRNNNNNNNNNRRRRRPSNRPQDFYYAESPDDIPFELYEMMEEEPYYDGAAADMGNPFGYYTGDVEGYDMPYGNATPFYGGHQMSGGVPPFPHGPYGGSSSSNGGGGRVYNSARNASYKPSRHHRGGTPHKNRRSNNNNNNNNNGGSNNSNNKK